MKVKLLEDVSYRFVTLKAGEVFEAAKAGTAGYELYVEVPDTDPKRFQAHYVRREFVEVVDA